MKFVTQPELTDAVMFASKSRVTARGPSWEGLSWGRSQSSVLCAACEAQGLDGRWEGVGQPGSLLVTAGPWAGVPSVKGGLDVLGPCSSLRATAPLKAPGPAHQWGLSWSQWVGSPRLL